MRADGPSVCDAWVSNWQIAWLHQYRRLCIRLATDSG
jgi:hypothetical protein